MHEITTQNLLYCSRQELYSLSPYSISYDTAVFNHYNNYKSEFVQLQTKRSTI